MRNLIGFWDMSQNINKELEKSFDQIRNTGNPVEAIEFRVEGVSYKDEDELLRFRLDSGETIIIPTYCYGEFRETDIYNYAQLLLVNKIQKMESDAK
jgi:hypothetical protein